MGFMFPALDQLFEDVTGERNRRTVDKPLYFGQKRTISSRLRGVECISGLHNLLSDSNFILFGLEQKLKYLKFCGTFFNVIYKL